jgi:mRNA interferase MazF
MRRGEIRWASRGSGARQPLLVVQENEFNDSLIPTVVCAVISANLRVAHAPGNVFLSQKASGLSKDTVANVAQLVTVERKYLSGPVGVLGGRLLREVDEGIRLVLAV